uniref:Saposin B-type domain-containing protein n=1 Tax=Plectus sambesii TaxID=2011161 RepID=A0A914XKN2_9BILA
MTLTGFGCSTVADSSEAGGTNWKRSGGLRNMRRITTISACCSWHLYAAVLLPLLILGHNSETEAANSLSAKQKPIEVSDDEDFRCYFCRTDVARIKHEGVRNLINQYLTGDFDTSAVNENCDGRGNTSLMHNEPCPVRACLKIIVDDKKGIPFIIRGCASTFFGLTPAQFAEQNAKPEYANKFSSCQITPNMSLSTPLVVYLINIFEAVNISEATY